MAKSAAPAVILVLPGLALTAFWTVHHGLGGFFAGLLMAAFLVFGMVGIIKAGPFAAIGAGFLWLLALLATYLLLFFVERSFVGEKRYGPGGEYVADKMMDVIGGGLSTTYAAITSPPHWLNTAVIVVLLIGVVFCAAALAASKR